MDGKEVNLYAAADRAIREMNRLCLEAFGRVKGMKFDRNLIRSVLEMYRKLAKLARKRYYEIGYEAYLLAMAMCGVDPKKAAAMAEDAIDDEWIDFLLMETDPITLYRFDTETDRKAYRLAEALEVSDDRDYEVNKALRLWSQQIGQYALNVTDYAMLEAYRDAGMERVMWRTAKDERVCNECYALDGKVFPLKSVPKKPHYGCRCRILPAADAHKGAK